MGPLASANQQIRDAEREFIEHQRARLIAPQRLTDKLLEGLEELNLDDVSVVPADYGPALEDLRQQLIGYEGLSSRLLGRLQAGGRTADLIETIFAIQEVIAPPTLPLDAYELDDASLM